MKLAATEFLTLDGVYQGPGGPDEDRRGGFERGGWTAPFTDEEIGQFITARYEGMDAMLLGRVTWDIWASYWPEHDGGDPALLGAMNVDSSNTRRVAWSTHNSSIVWNRGAAYRTTASAPTPVSRSTKTPC